jgi:tetratricopeptide (TPR) repeat protein
VRTPVLHAALSAVLLLSAGDALAQRNKKLDEALAKAELQIAKGKDDEAVKILQKAASQLSKDPEAPLALALLLQRLGRLDDAGVAFGRAGELSVNAQPPVKARVLASRSGFALRAGQAGDALALAKQAVEARAGVEELAALARAEARLGEPTARATADKAVQAGAASAPAQLARGDALLAARLAKDAEAAYQRALELAPRSAPAATGLAFALAAQGKAARAIETARSATSFDAHSGEAHAALALGALAQDPLDKGNEAVSAAQQASFLEPRNPLVKQLLGRVFESRGQLDQANAAYTEAAGLDTSWPAPRVAMLALQFRKGDVDGALAGVRALPEELKRSGEAQLLLGRLLLKKEDAPEAAKAALDHAVAALPGVADAQAALGTAAYNVGELKQAADAYGRAVALEPDNLGYQSNYGLFLGYDDRLEQGQAVLLKLTERPELKDPGPFVNLGWIYRHMDPPKVTEAVAAYEKALKLDPKSGQAALGIALSYRAGRQWNRAVDAYVRVAQVDKRLEGEASVGTAWCYYRAGDLERTRFYTGVAARQGADVRGLRSALTKAQSRPPGSSTPAPARQREDDLAELVDRLDSKNAGLQARAVKGLLAIGRPAVPYLAHALREPGSSIAVRESIVVGLARLGPAAREALPHLDYLVKAGPPEPSVNDTPEAMERKTREAQLVTAMQSASTKIRGK